MPFLRVLRDKRGYETTYLMHWFRDGHRQRSRILYMFRTPPSVRVGRDVLDPAVVRELESTHPDIDFDWRALLDNRQVIDSGADTRRQHPGKPARRKEKEAQERPPASRETEKATAPAAAAPAPAEPEPRETPAPAVPAVPSTLEGSTREDQLAFLARWYPDLRDRLPHRTQDPVRREALVALIERLNAAAWQTEEDIAAGLQQAGDALERLSRIFSRRRRRARRPKPADAETRASNESS